MEPEVRNIEIPKQPVGFFTKKVIIISLITFILLMLAITAQFTYMTLNYDKAYRGVYINNTHVGNLSREEITGLLNTEYANKTKSMEITLKFKGTTEKIGSKELNTTYDIDKAVNTAYAVGRDGNFFERFMKILESRRSGIKIDMPVSYDKEQVRNTVKSLYEKTLVNVEQASLLIREDSAIIRSGHHGESFDKDAAYTAVEDAIKSQESKSIEFSVVKIAPDSINVDEFYNKICREVKDASFKIENNKLVIVPEEIGRSIDKNKLDEIIRELEKTENAERVLPISAINPKITTADVHAKLFKDTLYTAKSKFNTNTENNRNRSENIRIAASKLNGKILAPGETFSFNQTVGKRTVEAGYKNAYIYTKGKVVPDLAGGICQVSSTLYNAVLYSDLDVVERRNHMFVVTYVPYGSDATVFYGSTDFRFKNSTNWPIKIESYITKDNYLVFSLKGTNENSGKVVEISSVKRNEKDFAIKYIDDPNLPEGTTKILQVGHKGVTVDTYKTIKVDGKVVEKKKISTSTYIPLTQEVARGTKKIEPSDKDKTGQKPSNANSGNKPVTEPGNSGTNENNPSVNQDDTIDAGEAAPPQA